ncbi:MBOAT family O-acyltransferase [Aneurinibacillus tyrosinisolvens]|uniref:MBOAT family O-acyltransferase n=1 Tax=Aneurinibacillus tyrosinisolvens TaxID=1443435 RepID=UPI00063F218E|nr:MBOAT family protein [Aneurinibacillus tyrosinisolvens]
MLFNSYEYILGFLPVVFIIYFLLIRWRFVVFSKAWLALSSLFFYSWWNISYLPLLLGSILFNYTVGLTLGRMGEKTIYKRLILTVGIAGNLALLGYYKYADFFINNTNELFSTAFPLMHLILPLGISFFTFTQTAFLVDAYRGESTEYNFLNYILFVTFFPHLIAGPILHHKEMMPQFDLLRNKVISWKNISQGVFIFSIGLFKKVVIADTLAAWATQGFDKLPTLTFSEAWITSLSYTFQLYFDFSGYTDMAIGGALLFNIRFPLNFNSPYKSLNIQEFWRRWHITLGRFFRNYVYIPLGGNRKGRLRTYYNLLVIFVLTGFWHGAGWTFILWGSLHGIATVFHRYWSKFNIPMPRWLAWFLTFQFVNITWVFFRAKQWEDAVKVLKGMFGLNGIHVSLKEITIADAGFALFFLLFAAVLALFARNSMELTSRFKPNPAIALAASVLFVYSLLHFYRISEFLYFNF